MQIADCTSACQHFVQYAKSDDFKTAMGSCYKNLALKGHWVEVHIPEFIQMWGISGSLSESSLELAHHSINKTRVFPAAWMTQQFHKNVLRTSGIIMFLLLLLLFDYSLRYYQSCIAAYQI